MTASYTHLPGTLHPASYQTPHVDGRIFYERLPIRSDWLVEQDNRARIKRRVGTRDERQRRRAGLSAGGAGGVFPDGGLCFGGRKSVGVCFGAATVLGGGAVFPRDAGSPRSAIALPVSATMQQAAMNHLFTANPPSTRDVQPNDASLAVFGLAGSRDRKRRQKKRSAVRRMPIAWIRGEIPGFRRQHPSPGYDGSRSRPLVRAGQPSIGRIRPLADLSFPHRAIERTVSPAPAVEMTK